MSFHLVVTEAFGQYEKGQRITEKKAIAEALKEHAHRVVRVAAQPEPK